MQHVSFLCRYDCAHRLLSHLPLILNALPGSRANQGLDVSSNQYLLD
jgi:hypothetical protein